MNKLTARLGKEAIGLPTMPDELAEYMMRFHSAVEASVSTTDVENGYGIRVERRIVLKRPYCRCNRCGYHREMPVEEISAKMREAINAL